MFHNRLADGAFGNLCGGVSFYRPRNARPDLAVKGMTGHETWDGGENGPTAGRPEQHWTSFVGQGPASYFDLVQRLVLRYPENGRRYVCRLEIKAAGSRRR